MNKVVEIISEEIAQRGSITFARFMELALYCPVYGFYEREQDTVGRGGDFYTSVSVGSLFGELLAWQFAEWLEEVLVAPVSQKRQIVEAGAHEGRLAKDILCWLRENRPALFERIDYWIIEPSARRRAWQERTLSGFASQVRWVSDLVQLSQSQKNRVAGVIFSNELLDSFPVHRLGWDAKQHAWFEWGVTILDGLFSWTKMSPTTPISAQQGSQHSITPPLHHPASLDLPDEFITEVCPAAEQWWRAAASLLQRGKLLTIDYGLTAEEALRPERTQGTLRAYQGHHVSSDLLASPGRQDLTAHVNFSALQAAGESAGLKTDVFVRQEQFFTRIAARILQGESGEWSPLQKRQFQTLVHPEHLGRAFRVIVQARSL